MQVTFEELEQEYRRRVQGLAQEEDGFAAGEVMRLFVRLFEDLKVVGVSEGLGAEGDMLLCQYGVYRNRELGEHFSFGMTRQLVAAGTEEPYQFALALVFAPEGFEEVGRHQAWSADYPDLQSFVKHIKATAGFAVASEAVPMHYLMDIGPC